MDSLYWLHTRDPRTCTIFIMAWGSNWGSSGFFHNQNNRGSSGAYVTCICCGPSVKINTLESHKTLHGARRSWSHLFCLCFCVCGWKNPKTPNLSSMADDAITQGGIGPGSLVYIYGFYVVLVCSLKDEAWPLVKHYGLTLGDTKCRRECGSYSTTWNILVVYIGRISGKHEWGSCFTLY